jgi:hypothetical protein
LTWANNGGTLRPMVLPPRSGGPTILRFHAQSNLMFSVREHGVWRQLRHERAIPKN